MDINELEQLGPDVGQMVKKMYLMMQLHRKYNTEQMIRITDSLGPFDLTSAQLVGMLEYQFLCTFTPGIYEGGKSGLDHQTTWFSPVLMLLLVFRTRKFFDLVLYSYSWSNERDRLRNCYQEYFNCLLRYFRYNALADIFPETLPDGRDTRYYFSHVFECLTNGSAELVDASGRVRDPDYMIASMNYWDAHAPGMYYGTFLLHLTDDVNPVFSDLIANIAKTRGRDIDVLHVDKDLDKAAHVFQESINSEGPKFEIMQDLILAQWIRKRLLRARVKELPGLGKIKNLKKFIEKKSDKLGLLKMLMGEPVHIGYPLVHYVKIKYGFPIPSGIPTDVV